MSNLNFIQWLRAHRPHKLSSYVMPYLVVLLTVVTFLTLNIALDNRNQTTQIRVLSQENHQLVVSLQAAIVESCEKIGNERAQAMREQLHEEIMEAEHPDPEVIAAFNLPRDKIDELIAENVAKLKARLDHIKLVNCAAQYHISPGSGDRRRDRNADSSTP